MELIIQLFLSCKTNGKIASFSFSDLIKFIWKMKIFRNLSRLIFLFQIFKLRDLLYFFTWKKIEDLLAYFQICVKWKNMRRKEEEIHFGFECDQNELLIVNFDFMFFLIIFLIKIYYTVCWIFSQSELTTEIFNWLNFFCWVEEFWKNNLKKIQIFKSNVHFVIICHCVSETGKWYWMYLQHYYIFNFFSFTLWETD